MAHAETEKSTRLSIFTPLSVLPPIITFLNNEVTLDILIQTPISLCCTCFHYTFNPLFIFVSRHKNIIWRILVCMAVSKSMIDIKKRKKKEVPPADMIHFRAPALVTAGTHRVVAVLSLGRPPGRRGFWFWPQQRPSLSAVSAGMSPPPPASTAEIAEVSLSSRFPSKK